jgi:hypothetical protein
VKPCPYVSVSPVVNVHLDLLLATWMGRYGGAQRQLIQTHQGRAIQSARAESHFEGMQVHEVEDFNLVST